MVSYAVAEQGPSQKPACRALDETVYDSLARCSVRLPEFIACLIANVSTAPVSATELDKCMAE
jgi:hypothetical protein